MSLIWICFNKLGFTLFTAAVSFRFRLTFRTVLPVFLFAPAPDSVLQPSLSSIRFLLYWIRLIVSSFLQNFLLSISGLYQVSISNDFSLNFQTCWRKARVSTHLPFTDLKLNHFSSKNSNHRSIGIEMLYIYFHCLTNENMVGLCFTLSFPTFKAFRYLHSFESG